MNQQHLHEKSSIGPLTREIYGLKKCPGCDTYYFTKIDLEAHIETHWKFTRNRSGEWIHSQINLQLKRRLMLTGRMVEKGYQYTLIHGGEVIFRAREAQ